MDRYKLPYRKNCEAYLICKDGKIVTRDTGNGYLEFPGGGVDENEKPEEALKREAFEEAGVILEGELKKIKVLYFLWGKDWAKTEKQKQRYKQFKGEEMHFFTGKVKDLVVPKGDPKEIGWIGERTMRIDEAIKKINSFKPFPQEMKEYYNFQIQTLENFKNFSKLIQK